MEGTKLATDTQDCESESREAFFVGRSFCVSKSGPQGIENPAMSSSIVGLESQRSKAPGFASNVY